jgi:diguanylate cyclase (GGDEF)-like protein
MSDADARPRAELLLVEDDPTILTHARDYLTRAGFSVNVATTGWDALRALKNHNVDLIVSELLLADVDGSGLREKCLVNPETRDVPFLFIVPADQPEVQVRALRSGVDDVIERPFDPVVLVARTQAVLARRQAYQQLVRVDPLTRLLNRHTFESELESELSRARRYKREGTLILIDIDGFAKVNEESGTPLGDLLLTCLSGVVLSSIRNVDLAGRYRGEKLVIYLPETLVGGAEQLATRMQERLAQIADAVAGYPLTITCAIVAVPMNGQTVIQLANTALKVARHSKQQGPGKVVVLGRDVQVSELPEV